MELKICKTFNDNMEQRVEVVKAIKEEMVTIRQLQEKQGNILVALESSIQEFKEPREDETSGEDQPALDSMTINLDPSPRCTILQLLCPRQTVLHSPVLWAEMRDRAIPNEMITCTRTGSNIYARLHCQDVGPLQNNDRGAPNSPQYCTQE